MNIDKKIQEILQRTLPVNDNCTRNENKIPAKSVESKKNSAMNGINIIGNKNIIISANNASALLILAAAIFYFIR